MRVKFQADADLDARVVRGLKRKLPEIDIRTAADAGLVGLDDSRVLRIAAQSGRLIVTQDRRTMPGHFRRFASNARALASFCSAAALPSPLPSKNSR